MEASREGGYHMNISLFSVFSISLLKSALLCPVQREKRKGRKKEKANPDAPKVVFWNENCGSDSSKDTWIETPRTLKMKNFLIKSQTDSWLRRSPCSGWRSHLKQHQLRHLHTFTSLLFHPRLQWCSLELLISNRENPPLMSWMQHIWPCVQCILSEGWSEQKWKRKWFNLFYSIAKGDKVFCTYWYLCRKKLVRVQSQPLSLNTS